MCNTNWSKTYGAGVLEFESPEKALAAAIERDVRKPVLYEFNEFGERIK